MLPNSGVTPSRSFLNMLSEERKLYELVLKYHNIRDLYENSQLSYTVTEKGTVTIPVKIRKRLRLKKGSKVKFVDTEEGALLIPTPTFEELRGAIKKEIVYKMIKELEEERREEARLDET